MRYCFTHKIILVFDHEEKCRAGKAYSKRIPNTCDVKEAEVIPIRAGTEEKHRKEGNCQCQK